MIDGEDGVQPKSTTESAPEVQADAPAPDTSEPEVIDPVEEAPVDFRDARIADLEAQLAESTARLRTLSKAYTDLKDDMTSFQERMKGQHKAKEERAAFEAVNAFLDPVSNLRRSLAGDVKEGEGFLTGLELVAKQFDAALGKLGLQPIPGVGAPFDPVLHEALAVMPVADAEQDGMVLIVHEAGFTVKGKVLKASKVVIGKHEPEAVAEA